MVEATKKMFQNYANFSGRTSRGDFWWAILGYFLLSMVVGFVLGFVLGLVGVDSAKASSIAGSVWGLGTFLPSLAIEIRRLHDINKSGWWVLISLVPFVGGIILLVFMCSPSVEEGNNY